MRIQPSYMRMPKLPPTNNESSLSIVRIVFLFMLLSLLVSCNRPEISNEEKRAQNIGNSIMCPICPGESIDQSQNELAVQMRSIVREKIQEGFTDQEVKQYFADRYGEVVLLEPTRSGITLLVWIIPPFALIIAGFAVFLTLGAMKKNKKTSRVANEEDYLDEDVVKYRTMVEEARERD